MSTTTFSAEFVNPPKHVSSNLIQIIFCYAIKCINSLVRLPNVISFHSVVVSNFVISNIIKRHIFIINKTSISELITKQGIKEMQSKDQLRIWLFNAIFNNISAFIGRGNRRKPPTCRKSLRNFIT
jgi:hypothetical protein